MTATPALQKIAQNLVSDAGSPQRFEFPAKDLTGAAVDISSGYTAELKFATQSNATPALITAGGTWVLLNTGIATLTQTAAQSAAVPCGESMKYEVSVSSDSGSTNTVIAQGTLTNSKQLV